MYTQEIAQYIISFLLNEPDPLLLSKLSPSHSISSAGNSKENKSATLVGYTNDLQEAKNYRVAIVSSDFFSFDRYGHEDSIPRLLPLPQWRNTPLLFGTPREQEIAGNGHPTLLIYADIVASSYFLISRYEEMLCRDKRDVWGRFLGKDSLPYRAGFLERAIVDEYGQHLREILVESGISITTQPKGFSRINLSHDIDQPYAYRGIRSFARGVWKEKIGISTAYQRAFGPLDKDPYFSFADFLKWNKSLQEKSSSPVRTIFFYKTPGTHPQDKPNYHLHSQAMRKVVELAKQYRVIPGLHVNLSCSLNPYEIENQRILLERELAYPSIELSRHHFLASREPEDLLALRAANIRHDYSMGYPDLVGFRLGTSRPVRFILPATGALTDLLLHPLPIMDYTLHSTKYMALNYEEALEKCVHLIHTVYAHHGELNLLFHNENLSRQSTGYHVRLYRHLLREILTLERQTE